MARWQRTMALTLGILLGAGALGASPLPRILTPDSSAEARVRVATRYQEVTVPLKDTVIAVIQTNKGTIRALLYPQDAPITVQNFVRLALLGFYDGLTFHRYVPNFVIQGGDPTGTGRGNAGYTIPLEVSQRKHVEGALGMARARDPNSGSCQFYITLRPTPHLDGHYTVFGRVLQGMEVVHQLRKGDRILRVDIEGVASSPAEPQGGP